MLVRSCGTIPRMARAAVARRFSELKPSQRGGSDKPTRRLQFSKERLTDFGELPRGEIPDALQYNPMSSTTTLDNGVTVATEIYGSQIITLGFHWKYGSRHETPETSGMTHFLQNLRFRGSEGKTRADVEKSIHSFGSKIYQEVDRERNSLYVTCLKSDVEKVVGTIGQVINNTTFQENQLEAEREIIYRNIINQHRDMMELTLENIHYTSFRDHQLGQPTLGVRENAATLSLGQIKDFISQHHTGGNLTVTATGDVDHSQLVAAAQKSFGGLQRTTAELPNSHQPYYTPSLMFMADDELANLNVAAFMKAPAYSHPDSTLMRLVVELLGEYQADKNTATNLNDASLQYNSWHSHLGDMTDISLHKCFYFGYSDAGLLGNYILGNEILGAAMIFASQNYITRYSHGINQAEVFRARAKIFNDLLNRKSSIATNRVMAADLQYLGRVVPRSEIATKVSAAADQNLITQAIHNYFFDSEVSATVWGPLHNVLVYTHYNRPWKRSTLGAYGMFPGEIV